VVFKKAHIVEGRFDPQYASELVVHLDGGRPHVVLDACAQDMGGEIGAELALKPGIEFTPEEGRNVIGLDGVDAGADQDTVEVGEGARLLENDVGSVFHLHEAPVVADPERFEHGAVLAGKAVEGAMESGVKKDAETRRRETRSGKQEVILETPPTWSSPRLPSPRLRVCSPW